MNLELTGVITDNIIKRYFFFIMLFSQAVYAQQMTRDKSE